jgi:hypothetical protein
MHQDIAKALIEGEFAAKSGLAVKKRRRGADPSTR